MQLAEYIRAVSAGSSVYDVFCNRDDVSFRGLFEIDNAELARALDRVEPQLCDPEVGSDTVNALGNNLSLQYLVNKVGVSIWKKVVAFGHNLKASYVSWC